MEGCDAEVTAALEAVDATLDALRSRDDTQGKFKAFSDFAKASAPAGKRPPSNAVKWSRGSATRRSSHLRRSPTG